MGSCYGARCLQSARTRYAWRSARRQPKQPGFPPHSVFRSHHHGQHGIDTPPQRWPRPRFTRAVDQAGVLRHSKPTAHDVTEQRPGRFGSQQIEACGVIEEAGALPKLLMRCSRSQVRWINYRCQHLHIIGLGDKDRFRSMQTNARALRIQPQLNAAIRHHLNQPVPNIFGLLFADSTPTMHLTHCRRGLYMGHNRVVIRHLHLVELHDGRSRFELINVGKYNHKL